MTLTDNLISYWKLDETSGDRADELSVSVMNDDSSVGYAAGKISNAADFVPASSDSLSRAGWAEPAGDFSFSFWVYIDDKIGNQSFISKDAASNRSLNIFGDEVGNVYFYINDTSGLVTAVAERMATGAWYHIVCTYDYVTSGTSVMRMYINGTEVSNSPKTDAVGPMADTSSSFQFGAREYTTSRSFMDGRLDEIGYWTRVLSSTEVTQLYNGGSGLPYPLNVSNIKSLNGLAYASVKSKNGLAIASIKNINGLS